MEKYDGGPAFPVERYFDEQREYPHPGMTLRDYFAAKAMMGVLANTDSHRDAVAAGGYAEKAAALVARVAYAVADAMLAERHGHE